MTVPESPLSNSLLRRTVVIATDSFKSSISAEAAAAEIAAGWGERFPHDELLLIAQADGGEGTLDAIERSVPGAIRCNAGAVTGPDGRPTAGAWLELPGGVAIVELAQCSGLPLMAKPDALGATTRGLGEVIGKALDAGARSLVIALGGSASTDGGTGALRALGLELFDRSGVPLAEGGAALAGLVTVDIGSLRTPPPDGVTLLTDVSNPLTGSAGAAAIFGPQKGANPAAVEMLDAALVHLALLLPGAVSTITPGTGAAGGTAWGFASVWGATITPGSEYLARLTGLEAALSRADVVITGEGRFDETSLNGKVVGHVIALAQRFGIPVTVIAGQLACEPPSGIGAISLAGLAGSIEAALADPRPLLRTAARLLAHHQSLS